VSDCVQTRSRGHCDPRFAAIRQAFEENFAHRGEVGASVAIVHRGELVVDLWGGSRDAAGTLQWDADTLVCVQSVTKEVVALALHIAADRGLVDLDAPVARYWPEYASAGKQDTKVKWLLDHRAGVPVAADATPGMAYDWLRMTEALARTQPLWEPGTTPCYHSANYGFLVGAVLWRVTGMMPSAFIREHVAGPLGIEFCIGLRQEEEARVATFLGASEHVSATWVAAGDDNIFGRSWRIFWPDEDYNSSDWRQTEIPSVNGHSNARSLARICAAMAEGGTLGGVRLLSPAAVTRAAEIQWTGTDAIGRYLSMSLGFIMTTPSFPTTGPRAIGMSGAGGATAFGDPDRQLGFAYTMNSMYPGPERSTRSAALVEALQSCCA